MNRIQLIKWTAGATLGIAALAIVPATLAGGESCSTRAKDASHAQTIAAGEAQLASARQAPETPTAQTSRDLASWLSQSPKFSTLWTAIEKAGLSEELRDGHGRFTIYAPTNDAFARLPDGKLNDLLRPENRDQLRAVLNYHIVSGANSCEQACQSKNLKTAQGGSLVMADRDGRPSINGALVLMSDVPATNGYINVIDSVLLPPG